MEIYIRIIYKYNLGNLLLSTTTYKGSISPRGRYNSRLYYPREEVNSRTSLTPILLKDPLGGYYL